MVARGRYCRACGSTHWLQADHVKPRSQGGPSVVENGLILCQSCHQAKTESRLQIRFEWLDADQVRWLAEVGWVRWEEDGSVSGRGLRHFAPRAVGAGS